MSSLLIKFFFHCRDACVKFTELWKRKHETGQWFEIEAAEAMSSRSDFSAMNGSGIVFSNMINKQKELKEAWPEISGNHGKAGVESSTGMCLEVSSR